MKSATRFRKTKIALTIIYIVILAAYGIFLFQNFQAKRADSEMMFGSSALYHVDSGFGTGVFAQPQQDYVVGDNVVCKTESGYVTGKISEIDSPNGVPVAVLSQGDDTRHVAVTAIRGVITREIPAIGGIYSFLKSPLGVVLLVVLPCVAFLIYQIVQLTRTLKSKKQQEDEEEVYEDYAPFARLSSLTPSRGELTDRFATLTKVQKEPPKEPSSIYKPAPEHEQPQLETLEEPVEKASPFQKEQDMLDELLSEMRYKMEFQDTQQLTPVQEHSIGQEESASDLSRYGLQTELIEDGIEVDIDSTQTNEIKLRLKNDGSLSIITDLYQAEINSQF